MPAVGLAALLACLRAAPLRKVPAAPVATLPARHGGPRVLSGAKQGVSPSPLPRSPCSADVPRGIPGTGTRGRTGPGAAAGQAGSTLL